MHSQLEEYLDNVEKPLAPLPTQAREEWREEARQHLESLVAAHEELGSSQEEAVEAALLQFGDAQTIGQQVRAATLDEVEGWRAASIACMLVILPVIFWLAAMGLIGTRILHQMNDIGADLSAFHRVAVSGFLMVPLLGGYWAGCYCRGRRFSFSRSRRRAGWVYLPWMALAMTQFVLMGTAIHYFAFGYPGSPDFNFGFGLLWLPMTAVGFRLGRGKKRRRSRVLANS